jgi:hypothetical protein
MSATYASLRRTAAAWWGAVRDALAERRARRMHLRQLERIFG